MTRLNRALCAVVFAALVIPAASAQVQLGMPKYASMGGGPADKINLGSLNVDFQFPVRHKPGRGLAFNFDLNFDSSVWEPIYNSSTNSYTWGLLSDLGWSGSSIDIGFLFDNYSSDGVEFDYDCVVYYDGLGGGHSFPQCAAFDFIFGIDYPIVGSVTTDGSGYTLNYDPFVTGVGNLTTAQGNAIIPRNVVPLGSGVKAGSDIDRNGNEITISSTGSFTDSLGTTALTESGGCTSLTSCAPFVMGYTAPSGATANTTVTFKTYTVRSNFGCSGVSEFGATSIELVDKITLPDGSYYQLTYEATPGFAGDVTARPASVRLPTGGTVSYAYSGSNNGIICGDGSTAGFTRTTPDGVSTYSRTLTGGNGSKTTITDPAGNQTVITFQRDSASANNTLEYFEVQRSVYQGSTSGTLLQTINTCYNGSASPCTSTAVSTPLSQRSQITQLGTVQKKHVELFNSTYGMPTETDDYDYGTGAPGALLKKAIYTYPSNLGSIKVFWSTVTVQNGSGVTVAQTTNNYDETTVVGTTGTPQHVGAPGASRGNLTSVVQLVAGTTTHKKTNTYFDTGNVDVATDFNGAKTTYTYGGCGNSFVTNVAEPLSLSSSGVWNCTGGVETSTTDENGKITTTKYTDPYFWRPSSVVDPTSATTTYCYGLVSSGTCALNPNETETTLSVNAGASAVDIFQTIDSQGRSSLRQVRQTPTATTFDSSETYYDNLGRNTGSSLPYSGTAGQTTAVGAAPKITYDPLGRISQATDSGGGTLTYTYTNNDAFVTLGPAPSGENTKRKQVQYDGLGRLTSVCEVTAGTTTWPGGTCSQSVSQTGYWTKYTYDALSDLTGVTQNAQSSTNTQIRSYTYDDLSRKTSETNGESGTTSYTYDTDTTCGTSTGDAVKKVDAVGNTTCVAYDALHRPTSVTYPSGSYAANTAPKHFVYDTTTFTCPNGANVKKRLAEAYTGTSSAKITDLAYCFSPRGEVTEVFESTPHSAGTYSVPITYWENGVVKTFGPFLTEGQISITPDGEGRINVVSGGSSYVQGVTYNFASQPTQVLTSCTGPGQTCYPFTYTYDPNTLRTTGYAAALSTGTLSGTMKWNPNGSLQSLIIADPKNSGDAQTCTYGADDLGRLASNSCTSTPAWSQTFSYDPFGNITKSGSISWMPGYSATTNRYSLGGTSYDSNGNVLNDSFNKYTWDAQGKPLSTAYSEGSGETWSFVYDAFGHAVELSVNGTYEYSYLALGSIRLSATGQTAAYSEFPLPGGSKLSTLGGATGVQLGDWLGTIRSFVSYTGGSQGASLAHAPFGESYAYTGGYPSGFAGQGGLGWGEGDDGGMTNTTYWFPERHYRSSQGRFLSPDPAGMSAVNLTDPQSWNRYAYVANRPLNHIDPQGLDGCDDEGDCGGGDDCDWCEWGSGSGGWFPGMPIGIAMPGQLPQQQSPCNYIICADSGGIDNLTNTGTAQNPNWVGDYPWEQLCPPGQPCYDYYWNPNTEQWDAPQPVPVTCNDGRCSTAPQTVNVTAMAPMSNCDKMEKQGGVTAGAGALLEVTGLALDAGGITLPAGVSLHAAGGAAMLAGGIWAGLGALGNLFGMCQ